MPALGPCVLDMSLAVAHALDNFEDVGGAHVEWHGKRKGEGTQRERLPAWS